MELTLTRLTMENDSVIGRLDGLSKTLWVLEDKWRNNQRSVSCVPVGKYVVKPHGWEVNTPFKYKRTWQLQNVTNRTGILIHAGNIHKDTEGCLLVGMGCQISQTQTMVNDSKTAIEFLRKEIGEREFTLTIK